MSIVEPPCVNILVVEDHGDTAELLKVLLARMKHNVTVAHSGEEALQVLSASRFDLLVCDIGLPRMSGIDLMRQVRQQYNLPAIALSGYGMEQDRRASREAGFNAHVLKPVDFEELVSTIHRVCVESQN